MSTFNVSFPAFIAQAASVAAAAQTVITNAGALFAKVSAIVAQVESDFAAVSGQGATKKQLVMLYLSFAVQELVDQLMGRNPEHRFNFIQNNAGEFDRDDGEVPRRD